MPSTSKDGANKVASKINIRKRKIGSSNSEVKKSGERKYLRSDAWEYLEKYELVNVLQEMIQTDENLCFGNDVEAINEVVKLIKPKLDARTPMIISERKIQQLILHHVRHFQKTRTDEPIDKWLEMIRALTVPNKHLKQQLKSALMVAIEEPIPVPKQEKSVDDETKDFPEPNYSSVYKYLACAVSGAPLPELSPIDSLLVEDCIQSLMEQIKSLDDGDLRLNLRKIFLCLNKAEDQPPEDDQEEITNQLCKGSIYNPLGINENLIVPVPPEWFGAIAVKGRHFWIKCLNHLCYHAKK